METLPEEMVEAVAVHLTLRDLEVCSLVSRGWRDAFNKDSIWRRHSFNQMKAIHFRETPTVVEPQFQLPDDSETFLSAICEERIRLLQEKHLWNNWREGRFEKSTIVNEVFVAKKINFLTNNHLVLLHEGRITIWNVHDETDNGFFEPVKFPDCKVVEMCTMISGDRVVVVSGSIVHIFLWDLNSTQWSFQCAFDFVERTNKLLTSLDAIKYPTYSEQLCVGVFGSIFFGCCKDRDVIHIWNLEKLKRIGEQTLPTTDIMYHLGFQFDKKTRYVLIPTVQSLLNPPMHVLTCHVYDLTNLTLLSVKPTGYFTDFCRFCRLYPLPTYHTIIHGKFVSISNLKVLYIFNIETNETTPVLIIPVLGIPQVICDNFVFCTAGKIEVYDPIRHKITTLIDDITVNKSLMNIGKKFFVMYHKTRKSSLFCDVWETDDSLQAYEAKTKLIYFNPGVMLINEACTVLLCISNSEGRLCKLNFW